MTGGSGRTLARAGLIVTAAYLASRGLGWVRLAVIGTTFGAGADLDSFFAAFRIPDFIFQLVAAGALSSALIPILASLTASEEDERAWRVASTVTNLMVGTLAILAALVWLGAPLLVPIIAPGFDPVRSERTIELTRILVLSPLLLALAALATSILNARGRFAVAAFAPLAYNGAIILAAVFLTPMLGVAALAVGVVVGAALNFLVQVVPLNAVGFRWRPRIDLADREARQALILLAPRALGLAASQLTFIVATSLASGLAVGSLAAFSIAFSVFQIPYGVIGVPIGIVALPTLATELARGDVRRFGDLVTRASRLVIFVMLPLATLGMVMRVQILELLFDYGKFTDQAIARTATSLLILLLALPTESLIGIVARAFYAMRDTRTPVIAAVVAVVINTVFAVATVGPLGIEGIALGIVLGSFAEAGFLLMVLARRTTEFSLLPIVRVSIPAAIGAAAAAGIGIAVLDVFAAVAGRETSKVAIFVVLVVATALGGMAYIALSRLFRIPELGSLGGLIRSAIRAPESVA